jgi:3-dehydroquinate dehydratase/shikimate dehydrogenase
MIVITVTAPRIPARPRGARFMAEVRADFMSGLSAAEIVRIFGKDIIFTCRRECDGGRFIGPEKSRIKLLKDALCIGVRYVDIELDVLEAGLINPSGERTIASYHDFKGMPVDAGKILKRLEKTGAEILKLAATPRTHRETAEILRLYGRTKKPLVAFGMGETGFPSRILGRKFGAPWTYAAADGAEPAAPGMPTVSDLVQIYGYENINPRTAVYGVAGNPVSGSAGPFVFNQAFRKAGLDAVYLPFRADCIEDVAAAYAPFGLKGLSITSPLKEDAYEFIRAGGGDARGAENIEAVNTMRLDKNGLWRGRAFDGPAAISALGGKKRLAGKTILVLGAGGAAKALAAELGKIRCRVYTANRTRARSKALESLGARIVGWKDRTKVRADVVVNATTLGMYGNDKVSAVPAPFFRSGMLAMDMVYNPARTRFLEDAASAGARTVGGAAMYFEQARKQFEFWTAKTPDFPSAAALEKYLQYRRRRLRLSI